MLHFKALISAFLFIGTSTLLFGQETGFINLEELTRNISSDVQDFSHIQLLPQYERNQSSSRAVSLELYSTTLDASDDLESRNRKLAWIQNFVSEENRVNQNLIIDGLVYGEHAASLRNDALIEQVTNAFSKPQTTISYENSPQGFSFTSNNRRAPQNVTPVGSLGNPRGRLVITIVRIVATSGFIGIGFYVSKDVDVVDASILALFAGVASGSLAYYSAPYGRWLTNGSWSRWLLNSDTLIARGLRSSMNIQGGTLARLFTQNEAHFRRMYPAVDIQAHDFQQFLSELTNEQFTTYQNSAARTNLLSRLSRYEEFLKWWLVDVLFTAVAANLPQTALGIQEFESGWSFIANSFKGGSLGFLAQGFGDTAVNERRYQMVEELRENLTAGRIHYEHQADLLEEIARVLDKTGDYKHYSINSTSHPALIRIENLTRIKSSTLSFFCVLGVVLGRGEIPLGNALLISAGSAGLVYASSVHNWFNINTHLRRASEIAKQKLSRLETRFAPYQARMCGSRFLPGIRR